MPHNNGDQIAAQVYARIVKKPDSPTVRRERSQRNLELATANKQQNVQWRTNEFGATIRLIQEMQGGVKTPGGGLLQFHADRGSNHAIIDLLSATGGVERMRTDGLISCCALEAHADGFSVLLHGFGADNLQSLFVYSLAVVHQNGGDLSQIQPITLYAENHADYQTSILELNEELGVAVPVEFGGLTVTDYFAYPVFPTIDVV